MRAEPWLGSTPAALAGPNSDADLVRLSESPTRMCPAGWIEQVRGAASSDASGQRAVALLQRDGLEDGRHKLLQHSAVVLGITRA